ncbi:HesA/MoeB/ThiF family protein, partial [Novosphingobium naphthalenivorans]|uniref:HesA/MoeB/ThiF family protein n=1 Tax=Novosphingobium naphthalenivorans TaxID=273168 RepID=UPI000B072719
EVTNEYQDYWRDGLLSFRIFASRTPPSSNPLRLGYFRMEQGIGEPFFGLHSDGKLDGHKCDKLADAMLFQTSKPITPVGKIKVPFTLAHLKQWFLGQEEMDEAKWDAAFRLLSKRGLLAISAPNCVLGVRLNLPHDLKVGQDTGKIRQTKIPDLLMSRKESVQLTRFGGYWCDLASLAERNLKGMTTFADKTIALVGCGTIGGYLAKFLAQSGAGANKPLFLIDRQLLSPGNIGRHLLGTAYIGMPKAEALRDELKRFHPDCDARAVSDEFAACLDVVRSADLIVDASGEWNTQCALNGQFFEDQEIKAEAILHSWICGNGAAVQSFTNLKGDDFCFRCMRPDPSKPSRYTALNPKTEAVIEEATCGDGAYFPYSVAAPSMAAGLTLEMALGVINGKPGSRLRTIVLDHKRGIERKPTTPTAHKDCPSCKARAASD